jgi:peptide/nickel transport system substrate-binding protein
MRSVVATVAAAALLVLPSSWPAVGQTPARGGDITASVLELPQTLDPLLGNSASIDPLTLDLIFDTLVEWDDDGNYGPGLADSWEFNEDGTVLTLHLREGIQFHDGTPFNADAVVFNLERAISEEVNSPYRANVSVIASVQAVDDATVQINMASASGAIVGALTGQPGMMASPAAIESAGEDFGRNPVGTGPYVFESWPSGGDIKVVRNANYWRDGQDGQPLPYIDQITMRGITNSSVKLLELETGNVDIVDNIVPREFERIEQTAGLDLVDAKIGIQQWYAVNTTRPPFDNPTVRKALQYALNRQQMIDIVSQGRGEILPAMFTQSEWVYDPTTPYSYDPDMARQLLTEAGHADGLTIELTTIQREPDTTVAQLIQAQLAEVGIMVTLDVLDRQAFIDKNEAAEHQMSMGISPIPRGDPDIIWTIFFSRSGYARSGEPILEVAELVEQARGEVDQATRKEIYQQAQAKMLEHAAYGWLFVRPTAYAKREQLKNVSVDPAGRWHLEEAWLEE